MRLRRIGAVLVACAALTAVATGSAQGAWTVGSSGTKLGATETRSLTTSGAGLAFHSELLGIKFTITATGVTCLGCTIDGTTANGVNHLGGKFEFTGVTIDTGEPPTLSTCTVSEAKITTTAVTGNVKMVGTSAYAFFRPQESEGAWAEIPISGSGCALAGNTIVVRGELAGKLSNATGVLAASQAITFSEASQKESGASLFIGSKKSPTTAYFTGVVTNKLSTGEAFGADE